MVIVKRVQILASAGMVLSALIFPCMAKPEAGSAKRDGSAQELRNSDKREAVVQLARAHVLSILQAENGCSAWFREADADAAGVFDSLNIQIVAKNRGSVLRSTDGMGMRVYKHPWGARSNQMAGRNSRVELNPSGPFFIASSPVIETGTTGVLLHYIGYRNLSVGEFQGNTVEARLTILLHELAHVIGRIPEDDDSWDGRSSRNTEEVLHNCKSEIENYAQKSLQARN